MKVLHSLAAGLLLFTLAHPVFSQEDEQREPTPYEIGLTKGAIRAFSPEAGQILDKLADAAEAHDRARIELLLRSMELIGVSSEYINLLDQASQFKSGIEKLQEDAGEATVRIMGALLEGLFTENNVAKRQPWQPGLTHPRYPNVVSSTHVNVWIPAEGYIWLDGSNQNDWTVVPSRNDLSSLREAGVAREYAIIYKGKDGVNIRTAPGSSAILATAYHAPGTTFQVLSSQPTYISGAPWVKVRFVGWMARKNLRSGDINIATMKNHLGYVSWDGSGDPNDNFVAMRTLGNNDQRVAKVYYNTSLRIGRSTTTSTYEWVEAEVIGWLALRSPKGTTLAAPR